MRPNIPACTILLALTSLLLSACPERSELCGNGRLESLEECEGEDLAGESCLSLGFRSGELSCTSDCTLDDSGCSMEEVCDPPCDPLQCQTCFLNQCVSICQDWQYCQDGQCDTDAMELTLFFTSDEHGYLEAYDDGKGTVWGGFANLMARLRDEGYDPQTDDSILLSDGDMWTGPAISTTFSGESVVQVMNAMGYSAAAVGNHEFDFGREKLLIRSQEADFPFLAANIILRENGQTPDFAQPFTMTTIRGVPVGVIGLITDGVEYMVCSDHLDGLDFLSHSEALHATVPLALAQGAQVLVVVAHACPEDLARLSSVAAELGIAVMGAGHCHQSSTGIHSDVVVVSPGASGNVYGRVDLLFDQASGTVVHGQSRLGYNSYQTESGNPVTPDTAVEGIIDFWHDQTSELLDEVIGYTETGISRSGWCMHNMVADAWLDQIPEADVAMNNLGGIRTDIPPGDIDLMETMAVMPFQNDLVLLTVSGAQLLDILNDHWGTSVAGIRVTGSGPGMSVLVDGQQLDQRTNYTLVATDFLYCLPDYFDLDFDPEDVSFTGRNWRAVVEDWMRTVDSNPEDPLEDLIDCAWRWSD